MDLSCHVENGGRFVSRGRGGHAERIISSWELIFVVRGKLDMFVGDEYLEVPAGRRLLIPAGVRHGGRGDYAPQLSFFWVHFAPADETAARLGASGRVGGVRNPGRLSDYFQRFLTLQESEPDDRDGLELLFALILHESMKDSGADASSRRAVPRLVHEAAEMLALRFREPLSTSVIARELKCDPDYLGRLYRASCGRCIADTLNEIRLRHAAELLVRSDMRIGEIAYEVGFGDLSYFRRRFFRQYALTPRAFRQQRSGGHVNTA